MSTSEGKARIEIPLNGFNLTQYMSLRSPMKWDFAQIHQALDSIEKDVTETKAALAVTKEAV